MSATMNKTVPWHVKGVGFDAREIAHRAARREGVPVGQWLNGVIRARADELGVSVDDFTQEERLDALVARLAGVAESVKAEENSKQSRTATSPQREVSSGGQAGAHPMSDRWTDDDDLRVRNGTPRRSGRRAEWSAPVSESARDLFPQSSADDDRQGRRWDDEILLDQAMELVERRTTAAQERAQGERQRMRIAALAQEVERLNRAEADATADRLRARARRTDPPSEAVHPVQMAAPDAAEPPRRSPERTRTVDTRPPLPARSDDNPGERGQPAAPSIDRAARESAVQNLDEQLRRLALRYGDRAPDTAGLRYTQASAEPAPPAPRAGFSAEAMYPAERGPAPSNARRGSSERRDAIADITGRQADLDGIEQHRAHLLGSTSVSGLDTAPRSPSATTPHFTRAERPQTRAPLLAPADPFENLNDAFNRLSERLEARLEEATRERVQAARQPDGEISALKNGIAALGTRLDAMKDQVEQTHAASAEREGLEALRNEIAALQVGLAKLAPHSSIATLESAVRELGGQIDESRREGVTDAVLQPIERLRADVLRAVEAGDVRGTLGRIEGQIGTLVERVALADDNDAALERLDELRTETAGVRALLQGAAGQFESVARLEGQIGQLSGRVQRLTEAPPRAAVRELELATNEIRTMLVEFSPDDALQDLSRKLDGLAERFNLIEEHVAAPTAMFDEFARRMDDAHAALAERLIRAAPVVDLGPIEDMIGGLSGKIDGLRYPVGDMQALGGLIRGLAAQIEEARLPSADARILDGLESQVGRLAERLDKSDANLDAIASVERLVRDLFSQMDETRSATVEAAETAARTAAQEAMRVSSVSHKAVDDEQVSARANRALEQVGQELSEFRKAQQTSEKRVHATLMALNETLERMVDATIAPPRGGVAAAVTASAATPAAGTPAAAPAAEVRPVVAPVEVPASVEAPPAPLASAAAAPAAEPVAEDAKQVEVKLPAAAVKSAAPAVDIGRPAALAEPMPDVSPLIAAARRAAQAAQSSAGEMSRKPDLWDVSRKSGSQEAKTANGWRSLFRQKRRPMLLSVASVMLLLGALEVARLSFPSRDAGTVETSDSGSASDAAQDKTADIAPAPKGDSKTASATPSEAPASTSVAGSTVTSAPQTASAASPAPSSAATDKAPAATTSFVLADPALKGLPTGLRTLADQGNAAAEAEIGARLSDGRGVGRDPKDAVAWFTRAADQGYAPAEYRLGSAYEKGTGVQANPIQAVSWYEKAATQGNVRAMHNLAVMAAEGSAGKADYARAATWFTKAAEHGVRDSQYNLAILYARGLGLAQDLGQSFMWFSNAAAQGDTDAAKKRDDVAAKLDPEKIAAAKAAAAAFKPLPVDKAANDILPPPGGWDVATGAGTPKVSSM